MNEGCEVHCPIYCRIPHLNSINLAVWSERCWCKWDTSSTISSSLAILFSKTHPDVQVQNHIPLYCWLTLIKILYPCAFFAVKYCTLVWERKFVNLLFFHVVPYLLFSCSNPVVQPARSHTVHTVHTVQCWQDFTWIKKWHPRHQNFHLFSSGKLHTLLLVYCLLPKSTKNLKAFKQVSLFLADCGSSVSQSVACNLFRGSSVGDISLCHTFTHLLFPISPPLSIYFSFSI